MFRTFAPEQLYDHIYWFEPLNIRFGLLVLFHDYALNAFHVIEFDWEREEFYIGQDAYIVSENCYLLSHFTYVEASR
jgi:hypothetical protein